MKFAKSIYCAGVDTYYVRLGSRHGEDCMFKCNSEAHAKHSEKLINYALKRDGYVKLKNKKKL
jgi:hypothetical protein